MTEAWGLRGGLAAAAAGLALTLAPASREPITLLLLVAVLLHALLTQLRSGPARSIVPPGTSVAFVKPLQRLEADVRVQPSPEPDAAKQTLAIVRRAQTLGLRPVHRVSDVALGSVPPADRASETSEALDDLMARVSHELRTPLNAVIGFSDVMTAELLGPVGHPRYREYVRHIRDSGRELLKSAEDALAMTALLASMEPERPCESVNLARLADDAWSFHGEAARRRGISLSLHLDDEIEVLAESRPLRQALVNLIAEAVARAPEGGAVRLGARGIGEHAEIELSAAVPSGSESTPHSLALSLARALLELQGATLFVGETDREWRAVIRLHRVLQADFFPARRAGPAA